MKKCPHCGTENWPENSECFACGGDLAWDPTDPLPPANPFPTQPVRVAGGSARSNPVPLGNTQPRHVRPAPPPASPAGNTQARGPVYPPPPRVAVQQAYGGQPPYTPAPLIAPPAHPERRDASRFWRIFTVILGLVVLCAAVFAVLIIGSSAMNRVRRIASQVPTLPAIALPGLPAAQPTSADQAPTAWPTFTSEAGAPAPEDGGSANAPTPAPDWEKYLTPECAAALAHLRSANQQFTNNPSAPLDGAWRDNLSGAVNEMKAYCSTPETASPVPNLVAEAQHDLSLATQEFDTADQLFKQGVEEIKPGKVFEAIQHISLATKYLGDGIGELNKIGK